MAPVKHGMSHWYDPVPLARVAIRVVISSVFGAFADRRELVAAVNPVSSDPFDRAHDYQDDANDLGEFWFDFLADTGDGWTSTRAVAQVASCAEIVPEGHDQPLPRGRLLVMGGDQVYPTASHKAYLERLVAPWESACEDVPKAPGAEADPSDLGDLYAIPGNHDWYDGLIAFSHLFARRTYAAPHLASTVRSGKIIARRQTRQVRSYFALKLPNGWWLWGTDSQLEGFIDQPQVDYFRFVAQHWMEPGSKLILCVGQPAWSYVDPDDPHKAFNSFAFLSRLAVDARDSDGRLMRHQLKLVLTGDAHHYSRYVEGDVHYVTAGGGGAFLHPTHHLRDHIAFKWETPAPQNGWIDGQNDYPRHFALARPGKSGRTPDGDGLDAGDRAGEADTKLSDKPALFPSRRDSLIQSFKTLAFAAYNFKFAMLYAAFYALLLWALDARTGAGKAGALLGRLSAAGEGGWPPFSDLAQVMVQTPAVMLMLLATLGVYVYFADWADRPVRRFTAGALHTLGHTAIFVCMTATILPAYGRHVVALTDASATAKEQGTPSLARPDPRVIPLNTSPLAATAKQRAVDRSQAPSPLGDRHAIVSGAMVVLASGLASATWFGLYLLISLSLFGRHWNEAFSAIRIRHFKNMLRMRITAEGLTLYPVGIRHVPGTDVPARVIATELIEPPVRIS